MESSPRAATPPGWQPLRFEGRVVFRQVLRSRAAERWLHSVHPGRWNPAFPALYTSLSLDVALAERLKRTGTDVTDLTVGIGEVSLEHVVDLTIPAALAEFGATPEDVVRDSEYGVPHRIATALHAKGIMGLLVPAALSSVSRLLPRFVVRRDQHEETHETPSSGIHLVIYPASVLYLIPLNEIETFNCTVWGLPG